MKKVLKKFVKKLLGDKSAAKKTTTKTTKKPIKKNSSDGSTKGSGSGSKRRRSPAKGKGDSSSGKSSDNSRGKSGSGRGSQQENRDSRGNRGKKNSRQGDESEKESSSSSSSRGNRRRLSNNSNTKRSRPDSAVQDRVHAGSGRVARPSRSRSGGNSRGRRPGGGVNAEDRAKLQVVHAEWSLDSFKVEPIEDKKRFHDFDLPSEIMHAVADLKFEYCTPIQALSLEHSLIGKNVAGRAQTGTGKTAAFLIAILTRYLRSPEKRQEKSGCPRALVIAPTRELVIQICKDAADIGKYCGLRALAVYGGMDYQRQQEEVLAEPIDLLVATPGRLLDYCRRRVIDLSQVDTLVIDEADRMLDMGFIPDVRMIMNKLPRKDERCTMLYSATLTQDVMRLASQWMEEPVSVEVENESVTTDTVEQVVYVVTASEKFTVLYNLLQKYPDKRILVFCNRKVTTEGIVRKLRRLNIPCDMLSGDVNQNRRLRVLEDFRAGKSRIVIATDVAGRGIHVDDISFVVNYDFPYEAEDYVHRIGRTGRAGHQGTAISFADEDESFIIPDIEKYIDEPLKCTLLMGDDPLMADIPKPERQRRSYAKENKPIKDVPVEKPAAPAESSEPVEPKPEDTHEEKPGKTPEKQPEKVEKSQAPAVPVEKAKKPERPKRSPRAESGSRRGGDKPSGERRRERPPAKQLAKPPSAVSGHKPRFSDEWVPGQ